MWTWEGSDKEKLRKLIEYDEWAACRIEYVKWKTENGWILIAVNAKKGDLLKL